MNTNFLSVIKKIVSEQGEAILADPQRLKGLISDCAKDEPKAERLAFGRCIEYGAYTELKNAPAPGRAAVKNRLVQRLHGEKGLDPALCAGALDLLEAALWGMPEQKILCPTCGKELQAQWSACPYCGPPAADAHTSVPVPEPSALPAATVNAPETIQISESEKKRDELITAWSGVIVTIIMGLLIVLSGLNGILELPIFDNKILWIIFFIIFLPAIFISLSIVEKIIRKIIGKKQK